MVNAITTLPRRCSLYQALLWIAEECPPIEDLIFYSMPDPEWAVVTERHKRDLFVALKEGRLSAEGGLWDIRRLQLKLENPCAEIEPKYWEWDRVDWEDCVLWIDSEGDGGSGGQFTEITVPAEALILAFPSEERPLELEAPPQEANKRRGRPPKFNWPAFWAEIAVRADLDGLPDTQAELERDMAKWCSENWGAEPGEFTVRQSVSLIYSNHRKGRK